MKLVAPLIALLTVAGAALAEITSVDLKHCPDGHTTLKDVPISYGVPAPDDWRKMERQLDNLEFVLGGCEPPADAPHFQPTCTTCRFGFDSLTKTWSRRSSDPHSFRRPFTSALQAFPIPPDRRDLLYKQWVRDYRLVKESVSYSMKRNLPELKRTMQRWVHTYHPKATYKAKGSWGTPEWRFGDSFLEYSPERGNVLVWLVQDVKWPSPNQTMQPTPSRTAFTFHHD